MNDIPLFVRVGCKILVYADIRYTLVEAPREGKSDGKGGQFQPAMELRSRTLYGQERNRTVKATITSFAFEKKWEACGLSPTPDKVRPVLRYGNCP